MTLPLHDWPIEQQGAGIKKGTGIALTYCAWLHSLHGACDCHTTPYCMDKILVSDMYF